MGTPLLSCFMLICQPGRAGNSNLPRAKTSLTIVATSMLRAPCTGGKLKPGAASRVRPLKKRKPGETIGRGGAGRLAIAVRRLSRTYDTHVVGTADMLQLLPKEFNRFSKEAAQAHS